MNRNTSLHGVTKFEALIFMVLMTQPELPMLQH